MYDTQNLFSLETWLKPKTIANNNITLNNRTECAGKTGNKTKGKIRDLVDKNENTVDSDANAIATSSNNNAKVEDQDDEKNSDLMGVQTEIVEILNLIKISSVDEMSENPWKAESFTIVNNVKLKKLINYGCF